MYTIRARESPTGAVIFTFPVGMRITAAGFQRRVEIVTIPFADGGKDVSDGMLDTSDVVVAGQMMGTMGPNGPHDLADDLETMRVALMGTASSFVLDVELPGVGNDFGYYVSKCTTCRWTTINKTGMVWADVECVFIMTSPAMYVE